VRYPGTSIFFNRGIAMPTKVLKDVEAGIPQPFNGDTHPPPHRLESVWNSGSFVSALSITVLQKHTTENVDYFTPMSKFRAQTYRGTD
jgi:hypothetical protein